MTSQEFNFPSYVRWMCWSVGLQLILVPLMRYFWLHHSLFNSFEGETFLVLNGCIAIFVVLLYDTFLTTREQLYDNQRKKERDSS